MAAVISGNGLGLFNSSASQIGTGLGGGARLGQGRDQQFVNVATGNLLLQSQDDQVLSRGMLVGFNRTYNSRGQLAQVGADAWLTGFERRVELLSGSLNSVGSVMRRHTGDGSYQDFSYSAGTGYVSTTGDGAHDSLSWDAPSSTWTYTEGSSRQQERYADHASATLKGRLTQLRNPLSDGAQPQVWEVVYDANGRIAEITPQAQDGYGGRLVFSYDANGRLASMASDPYSDGRALAGGRAWYAYDSAGRLASVIVDLTPRGTQPDSSASAPDHDQWTAAAGSNDGYLFKTTYSYTDATSLLISRVEQSDGTLTSYTYDAQNRIKSVTRGDSNNNDADGLGQTLSFSYDSATTTSVTDSSGRMWTYAYNAAGQLTEVRQPAVDGLRETTTYTYDAAGNVSRVSTKNGGLILAQTDYAYDANGNLTWQWERTQLGSSVEARALQRTYTANNQLASEIVYTGLDADGPAAGAAPSGGLTTNYLYDAQGRLRFAINAAGEVSEREYHVSGLGIGQISRQRQYLGDSYTGAYTLAGLEAWASTARKANSSLTTYSYAGAQGSTQRTFASVDAAGEGIETDALIYEGLRYDERGRLILRNRTSAEGSFQTLYGYDGLGRLMSERVVEKGVTIQSRSWVYQDSQGLSHTIIEGGTVGDNNTGNDRIRSEQRDAAGRLIYVKESAVSGAAGGVRESFNHYDSSGRLRATQDGAGARTYFFYDAEGQLSGQVDETGAVTEFLRDPLGRITATKRYATRVNPSAWSQAESGGGGGGSEGPGDPGPGNPGGGTEALRFKPETWEFSTTRSGWQLGGIHVFDLIEDVRPADHLDDRSTSTTYDALGRVLTQTDGEGSITTYSYDGANRLLQTRTTDAAGTAATARTTRYFHDAQGRETGRLDAEGYLLEYGYDRAGRRIRSIAYATATPTAARTSGSLDDLRPVTAAGDQTTRAFHDGRGNLVATLDAEGYLTEFVHDAKRLQRATKAYALKLAGLSGNESLATLRASAAAGAVRETRIYYDSAGRVIAEQNAEGTISRYSYDAMGNLVRSETAADTSEVREGRLRYNAFGELIGELHGEGAARVLPGMSEAQLDALYAQYGVRHGYNNLGQRNESIDAAGNKTWYFYDASGRSTFVVKGVANASGVANAQGEVSETRYNAFGEVLDTTVYTGRITLATAGSRDSAASAITTLAYVAANDSRRSIGYNHRGQIVGIGNAENALTRYTYNAFGERTRQELAAGTALVSTTDYLYDKRGLLTSMTEVAGKPEQRSASSVYDAFGRVISATDARGVPTTYSYDRLGRQLSARQSVLGREELVSTSYDAYGRVLSVTDAMGRTTTSAYDTANRTTTITTPEGVVVTTTYNRHGQQINVATPLPGGAVANTSYVYDRDGLLKSSTDALGRANSNEYDARGLLSATVDRSGRRVELRYDAIGRLLQRIEDPAGLALTTTYRYDGQGRQSDVTDASGRKTAYSYDREGRLTQVALDPAGLNSRTAYVYDVLGRQISVTEGAGTASARTVQYEYDALGRRTAERLDPAGLNLITRYAYDANDHVVRRTDATGNVTRFYYDEAGRMIYTVDPLGVMTRNWFSVTGNVAATRTLVVAINTATLTDATTIGELDARLAWNPADPGSYTVYDRDGRARLTLSNTGSIREFVYDAAGRVSSIRDYAVAWPDFGTTMLNKLFAGTAVPSDFDLAPLRNDSADRIVYQIHTALGELRTTVDNAGSVVSYVYDTAGRTVVQKHYAHAALLNPTLRAKLLAGTASPQDVIDVTPVDNATDPVSYTSYDNAGRPRYTVNAHGAVVERLYDAAGRTVGTRAYASAITLDATLKAQLIAGDPAAQAVVRDRVAAIANDARDLRSYQVYDGAGRIAASIDGAGYVSTRSYDADGRMILERRHAQAATISAALLTKLTAGTATAADIAAVAPVSASTDAVVRHIYDNAGRERYTLVQNAGNYFVSESRYDGASRVTAEYRYAIAIALGPVATPADVNTALNAAGAYNTADRYRSTQYVYDAAGRVRFTVDDLGAVSEQRYDGAGRAVESRHYGAFISIATPMNEAAIAAAVAGIGEVRNTTTTYDAMGRALRVTDALGQYEQYSYNALGQMVELRNKNGHVWNYGYDLAGRRAVEFSPDVWIASVDAAGTQTYATRRVVTRTQYDALGNVTARIENADTAQSRTTRYEYDNRGNQIRTIFPDAGKIDPANGQLIASGVQPTIEIGYDALGRAVVQKDVRGHYSYKVYDNLGRLAYDIDAENYVTGYSYDSFGQQTQLRRYAQSMNVGALSGWSPGQPLSLAQLQAAAATSAADRTITTRYDQRGLAVQIEQTQVAYFTSTGGTAVGSPTVRVAYDGLGRKVKESVLLEGTPDQANARWADSYSYYDLIGRVVMSVDAEGYLTRMRYNATGEMVENIEYAKAIWTGGLSSGTPPVLPQAGDEISGYDRITRLAYDALGRRTSQIVVRHFQRNDGSSGVRDVATQLRYDGENRVTQIINDTGTTTTVYDALGHTVGVTEPERRVFTDASFAQLPINVNRDLSTPWMYETLSPQTGMIYDAFGNVVKSVRFASGKPAGGQAVWDWNKDQIEEVRYDGQGRAVVVSNNAGNVTYTDYDAADNITHRWYTLSGSEASRDARVHSWYSYDKAGRQIGSGQTRDLLNGTGSATDLSEAVLYNAFGEIIQKGYAGVVGTLSYGYDGAGRLINSNETFGVKNFGYNLAGHQLRESHVVVTSDGQIGGGRQSVDATTFNSTDRLGRITATRLPSHTADPAAITSVQQRLDRWGNVLEVIDARGYQTNYRYNESNQVTRDERPLVEVVSETGASNWLRPVNQWFYDALGRLVGTRDANGNTRTNEYDAAGRLLVSKDALGQSTLFAYDALGNLRVTQNPLGYLTYKDYDRLGRVVEIGDYLPAAGASHRVRTALQRYWLNQNGDRLSVFDALNNRSRYDYDSRNLLIRSQSATGVVNSYAYDAMGHKTRESNALSGGAMQDRDGEWVNNNELTWDYDVYGRVIDHNNLSGRDFDYAYDSVTGQLTAESQSGGPAAYAYRYTTYYANGAIKALHENGPAPTYRYEYDAAGNRTLEEVNTVDGGGQAIRSITRTWYDSNNRIQRVVQDDLSGGASKRVFDLSYRYDAVGNRRNVKATSGYGPNVDGVTVVNNSPTVAQAPAARSVRRGMSSEFAILFSDVFRDAENDALTLQITLSDGSPLPSWLTVSRDPVTGVIRFVAQPPANASNQDLSIRLFAYETANSNNNVDTAFTLYVRENVGPQLLSGAADTLQVKTGQAWNKDLLVTDFFYDLDVGDRMRLSLDNTASLPAWLQLDASNPGAIRLSGVPQTGTYSLQLRATDEAGWSVVKTVQIVAAPNSAPTGPAPLASSTAVVGRQFNWSMPIADVFYDADGDSLDIVASGVPPWLTFQRTTVQGQPQLRLTGRAPDTAPQSSYQISFTATDPDGASRTTTMTVTMRSYNNNPTAPTSIGVPFAVIGIPGYQYQLPAFGDSDGDAIAYSLRDLPAGLSFNAATRTISGTATQLSSGWVTYIGEDAYGGVAMTGFYLHVRGNTAPVASSIPNQSAGVGVNWSYSIPPFSDAEWDAVSYTATGLPPGLSMNGNGQILGTPSAAGNYGVTVVGADPYGGSASTYFVISVNATPPPNRAPQINPARPIPGAGFESTNRWPTPYQSFSFAADTFVDPDGNPITYSFVELPGWLNYSFSAQYGHILGGYPPGQTITERIIMRAQDSSGAYVDMTFYVSTTYDHFDPGNPTDPKRVSNPVSVIVPEVNTFEMSGSAQTAVGVESLSQAMQSPATNATMATASSGTIPTQTKEFWYTYDAENRIRINNGQLVNRQIQLISYGEDSYELMYDAGGREVTRVNLRPGYPSGQNLWIERSAFDLRGNRTVEFWEEVIQGANVSNEGVRKVLSYDANNRLIETRSFFGASAYWDHTSRPGEQYEFYNRYEYGGWLWKAEQYAYDADGRLMYQQMFERNTSQEDWVMRAAGSNQTTNLGVLDFQSQTDYRRFNSDATATGFDTANRMTSYRYITSGYTHTYTMTHVGWESYQESTVTGGSTNNNYRTTTNTLQYDGFGRLQSQRETTPLRNGSIDDRMRYYGYNGDGSVQTRREGSLNSGGQFLQDTQFGPGNYLLVHAGGQQHAELKQGYQFTRNGNVAYGNQIVSLNGRGNYTAGGNMVSAQAGDTLRSVAKRVYGTDQLWYLLADANGLGDPDQELSVGAQLIAPNTKVSSNDANTFKPYNPAEAVGSTTPDLPYIPPPPKAGCGDMAKLIILVVVVAAAVFTGGAILAALPTAGTLGLGTAMFIGGVAGAAGALAGQVAGSVMGVSSFSWRAVAAGAITGAITGGIAEGLGSIGAAADGTTKALSATAQFGKVAAQAIGNPMAAYIGDKLAGLDTSFSWRNLVASSVTNLATSYAAPAISSKLRLDSSFSRNFTQGMTSSLVSAATRNVMGIGKGFDLRSMVSDAFGNALGSMIGDASAVAYATSAAGNSDSSNWESLNSFPTGSWLGEPNYASSWDGLGLALGYGFETGSGLGGMAGSTVQSSRSLAASYAVGAYENGAENLDRLVVTTNERFNRFSMDLWDWSTRYRQTGLTAATYQGVAGIVNYWADKTASTAPAYAQWLRSTAPIRIGGGPVESQNTRDARGFEQSRNDTKEYYDGFRGSILGDLGANAGTIFSHAGIGIAQGANSVYNLFTDKRSRDEAIAGSVQVAFNPVDSYWQVVGATSDFMDLSSDEQWRIIGTGAVSFVATAGMEGLAAKGVSMGGRALTGAVDALDAAFDTAQVADRTVSRAYQRAQVLANLRKMREGNLSSDFSVHVVNEDRALANIALRQTGTEGAFDLDAAAEVSGVSAGAASRNSRKRLALTGANQSEFDLKAERKYEVIRSSRMDDVATVAENTGISVQEVITMKKHLFFGRHTLPIEGTGKFRMTRFEADDEIAHAWQLAQKMPLSDQAKSWFRQMADHELGERVLMGQGVPYRNPASWDPEMGYFRSTPPGAHDMAPRQPKFNFPGYEPKW